MIDIEALDLQLERKLERYQRRYHISYANLAWILLRIGTNCYFKDICSRGLGNRGDNHHGRTRDIQQQANELCQELGLAADKEGLQLNSKVGEQTDRLGVIVTEDQIQQLAYAIWEQEMRPDDKHLEHYCRAKQILEEQGRLRHTSISV